MKQGGDLILSLFLHRGIELERPRNLEGTQKS